jgi:cyclopropane-fatty-acyl-phospholipid synthase
MLEAVGAEFYAAYFEACDRALVAGGRMSLQSITFPHVAYEPQLRRANWIQTYIFPGGLLPSLAVIERSLHGTSLLVRRVEDIAPHYVQTLQLWRARFLEQLDAVRAMGFDERFIRMWDYYLAISEASFATGVTQDLQVVLEKGRALG